VTEHGGGIAQDDLTGLSGSDGGAVIVDDAQLDVERLPSAGCEAAPQQLRIVDAVLRLAQNRHDERRLSATVGLGELWPEYFEPPDELLDGHRRRSVVARAQRAQI